MYLAGNIRYVGDHGVFRALSCSYNHWASCRLQEIEIDTQPSFLSCEVQNAAINKSCIHNTYILLG